MLDRTPRKIQIFTYWCPPLLLFLLLLLGRIATLARRGLLLQTE